MFNKYIKIVLALLVFALSIQQFIDGSVGTTGNGIMLILLSLVFDKNYVMIISSQVDVYIFHEIEIDKILMIGLVLKVYFLYIGIVYAKVIKEQIRTIICLKNG